MNIPKSEKKKIKNKLLEQKPITSPVLLSQGTNENKEKEKDFLGNNINYIINQTKNTIFNFKNQLNSSSTNPDIQNETKFNTNNTINHTNNNSNDNSFSNPKNLKIIKKYENPHSQDKGNYYQNLYIKIRNEYKILLREKKELENKNIINEQTIIDLIKDKRDLVETNEKLEKIIQDYKKLFNEKENIKEEKKNKNFIDNNNSLVKDNEYLQNELNKLIQDNIELKLKLRDISITNFNS